MVREAVYFYPWKKIRQIDIDIATAAFSRKKHINYLFPRAKNSHNFCIYRQKVTNSYM